MGDRGRREPRQAAPPAAAAAAAMRWTRRSVAHRPHQPLMHSINNQRRVHKHQARTATRAGALQAPKSDDSRQLCIRRIDTTHRWGAPTMVRTARRRDGALQALSRKLRARDWARTMLVLI